MGNRQKGREPLARIRKNSGYSAPLARPVRRSHCGHSPPICSISPIPTGGHIHLGDALIHLAARLCPPPTPWAPAMVGAGLAGSAPPPSVGGPHAAHQGPGGSSCLLPAGPAALSCPRNGRPLLLASRLLSPAARPRLACCWAALTPSGHSVSGHRWYRRWAAGRSLPSLCTFYPGLGSGSLWLAKVPHSQG